ncbi:MAG: serine/threonine-protein kinase [Cyanobacteria bacterium P01_A01_bin.83]
MERHQPGNEIINRYRIINLLGQGGTGVTYIAEDLQQGVEVVIKVVSFKEVDSWKTLELFEREAKTLASLYHPAIPRYIDYFHLETEDNIHFYLVQEWIKGQSLASLVDIGWRIKEDRIKQIAVQILEILGYLHKLNPPVIHRDIKPQNIILDTNFKAYLVDFGAVRNVYRNLGSFGATCVGTFGYMPPEQIRGQAFFASDLYSLGATILFLLTHRSPADLPQKRMKIDFRQSVSISEEFANWLAKMLEPVVEDRFNSATTALKYLQGKTQNNSYSTENDRNSYSAISKRFKPTNSKILLLRTDSSLKLKVPVSGLNFKTANLILASLAINFVVLSLDLKLLLGTPTVYFTGLGGFLLFIAFHLTAIAMVIFTLWHIFGYIIIKIEPKVFWVVWKLFKLQNRQCGQTQSLHCVEIITERHGDGSSFCYCALWHGTKKYTFGRHLTSIERSYLVDEILDYLSYTINLMY